MKRPHASLLTPPPEYELAIGASECARPDLVAAAADWLSGPPSTQARRRGGWLAFTAAGATLATALLATAWLLLA